MTFHGKIPGKIIWSHAVNDVRKLQRVLSNEEIDIVESDILQNKNGEIICAHPPNLESDLKVDVLIEKLKETNKGLKLDFKQPEVVLPVLNLLKKSSFENLIILNADILRGNNASASKFVPNIFISDSRSFFPYSILSLGWTTTTDHAYSSENVSEMLGYLEGIQNVTFPIRACLIRESWEHLSRLLKNDTYTICIWNNEPVNAETLEWVRNSTDPRRVFYDFIDESNESTKLI